MGEALTDPGTSVGRLAPWCPHVLEASLVLDLDPYVGCGILLRESWAGWSPGYEPKGSMFGWGDRGFAYSAWQIDRRFHAKFLASPESKDPRALSMYALGLVADALDDFRRQFPDAPPALHLDAAVAAYNAGPGRVGWAIRNGQRPASVTTGRDYSDDVLERAATLRGEHPFLFRPKPAALKESA